MQKVIWFFSDIESLSHTYKGFRERGIEFSYDYYGIEEEKYRSREREALLRHKLLEEQKALYKIKKSLPKKEISKVPEEMSTSSFKSFIR